MNCHITLLDTWKFKSHLDVLDKNCDIIKIYVVHYLSPVNSLRTDTQITFSLHFTPLGIRLSAYVTQPGAFLVLETIILGHYSTYC